MIVNGRRLHYEGRCWANSGVCLDTRECKLAIFSFHCTQRFISFQTCMQSYFSIAVLHITTCVMCSIQHSKKESGLKLKKISISSESFAFQEYALQRCCHITCSPRTRAVPSFKLFYQVSANMIREILVKRICLSQNKVNLLRKRSEKIFWNHVWSFNSWLHLSCLKIKPVFSCYQTG